eukprot:Lankesteria_metandrocarpae@DN4267_c0_g1_i3.p1
MWRGLAVALLILLASTRTTGAAKKSRSCKRGGGKSCCGCTRWIAHLTSGRYSPLEGDGEESVAAASPAVAVRRDRSGRSLRRPSGADALGPLSRSLRRQTSVVMQVPRSTASSGLHLVGDMDLVSTTDTWPCRSKMFDQCGVPIDGAHELWSITDLKSSYSDVLIKDYDPIFTFNIKAAYGNVLRGNHEQHRSSAEVSLKDWFESQPFECLGMYYYSPDIELTSGYVFKVNRKDDNCVSAHVDPETLKSKCIVVTKKITNRLYKIKDVELPYVDDRGELKFCLHDFAKPFVLPFDQIEEYGKVLQQFGNIIKN